MHVGRIHPWCTAAVATTAVVALSEPAKDISYATTSLPWLSRVCAYLRRVCGCFHSHLFSRALSAQTLRGLTQLARAITAVVQVWARSVQCIERGKAVKAFSPSRINKTNPRDFFAGGDG